MILWTIQPKNTLDIIKEKGVFTCDTNKSEWYNSSNEFHRAYDEVLLSDFDNWLLILNNDFVTECNNGKEWDEEQQWLDNLPKDKRKTAIINSWQRIFNLEAVNNDIRIAGSYIQATFWQLKKEMIRKVEYFTLTKHYHIF